MPDAIALDESARTWARVHVDAFEAPGGVPRALVPDKQQAATILAALRADRHELVGATRLL